MTIVLDASVALKLVTLEPGTAEAQALLEREDERLAPDWMLAEVASGLVKKVRYEHLDPSAAQESLAALPSFIDRFVPVAPLLDKAMELAARLEHALYDCLYLAIALEEEGVVVTADDVFMRAARRGGYAERTERLTWSK